MVAALYAAGDFVVVDNEDLPHEYRSVAIAHLASAMRKRLLGAAPTDDDVWPTDPIEVELLARSSEFEARLIDSAMADRVRTAQATATLEERHGRSGRLRLYAARVREAENAEVVFPTESETANSLHVEAS